MFRQSRPDPEESVPAAGGGAVAGVRGRALRVTSPTDLHNDLVSRVARGGSLARHKTSCVGWLASWSLIVHVTSLQLHVLLTAHSQLTFTADRLQVPDYK